MSRLFSLLSADFVARLRSVYVGAITVLLIFGIMRRGTEGTPRQRRSTGGRSLRSAQPPVSQLLWCIYHQAGRDSRRLQKWRPTPRAIGTLLLRISLFSEVASWCC